jgi:regulator of protease activity HflC (stomatin/prohibitin superfamily)
MPANADLRQTRERRAITVAGGWMILLAILLPVAALWHAWSLMLEEDRALHIGALAAEGVFFLLIWLGGFYTLQQNEAAVITLFSNYKGTDRKPGLRWIWPWYGRHKLSLRVRNVSSPTLKVNDKRGNPIEIAAVIVWRVADTAAAMFDVERFESFVNIQIETALREIASHFAYDHSEDEEPTLRANADEVSALLREKLQDRVTVAGVMVDEAKLSHLAYAPEIASAMLRRQQAEAILAARQKIVAGAVSMVESALASLSEREIVKLDDERRAAMVSNLLVVLCADREAQPVINAGAAT